MGEKEVLQPLETLHKPCEYPNDKKNRCMSTLSQFYATCVQCIFLMSLGMQFSMPTIVLGALHNKKGDPMELDDEDASWIGSTLYICHPIGSVISGFLSEQFGRKGAMMLVNIPFIGGWILLYCAHSVRDLYIATLTMGLGMGFCEAPIAAYLGEISEPHLRSIFTTMITAAINLGIMIELFVGSALDWRAAALVSAAVPVVSFLLFFTIAESPVWLITRGRLKDAQKSLGWLRGFAKPQDIQEEFDELVRYTKLSHALSTGNHESQEEELSLNKEGKPTKEARESWLEARYKELTNPKLYLPMRFVLISFCYAQVATIIPFRSYMIGILEQFWFPVDRKWILMMIGAMSLVGSMMPMLIIRHTGKRKLCLFCMCIALISILTLGLFATFFTHTESLLWSWLLIIDLAILYLVSFLGIIKSLGCSFARFSPSARGLATGISSGWSCFVAFLLTKSYLYTQSLIGLSGMFYVYGFFTFLGCIYFYFYMPETEGKTLEKIETYYTPDHDRKEKYRMPPRNSSKA